MSLWEWYLCLGGGADPKHNCVLHRAAVQLCMRHSGLLVASIDLFEACSGEQRAGGELIVCVM